MCHLYILYNNIKYTYARYKDKNKLPSGKPESEEEKIVSVMIIWKRQKK